MSLEKCQKYLYKLSNTNVNDEKFGLYLTKLNFWYEQIGGTLIIRDNEKKCNDAVIKSRGIKDKTMTGLCKMDSNKKWCELRADYNVNDKKEGEDGTCCEFGRVGRADNISNKCTAEGKK
jgi:hypothetical protein